MLVVMIASLATAALLWHVNRKVGPVAERMRTDPAAIEKILQGNENNVAGKGGG